MNLGPSNSFLFYRFFLFSVNCHFLQVINNIRFLSLAVASSVRASLVLANCSKHQKAAVASFEWTIMPIIDKELVSVNEDPSGYKPSVT